MTDQRDRMLDELGLLALHQHRNGALDAAAHLLAICRAPITDREPLYRLRSRQLASAQELIHTFAYHARKTLELSADYEVDIVEHAKSISVRGYAEELLEMDDLGGTVPLAGQSFWWVLGRIIHSRELQVLDHERIEVGTEWAAAPNITCYWTSVGFAVRSDHDGPSERHYVRIERLLESFVALQDKIARAVSCAIGDRLGGLGP